ncbi:MAG: tRNA epoxyqueuosine(34) reductase QueG [Candidatus Electryoneaceae bacterium]|nr:tRNA epoxyqueuosine(34) reductase QueG [Candidatus Electryoneaceae bacterium]
MDSVDRTDLVKRWAYEIGFDLVGIARAESLTLDEADHLKHYRSEGYYAEMKWLTRDIQRRQDPRLVLPECQSVVVVGVNYHRSQSHDVADEPVGRIAQFARSADYHKTMEKKVREFARRIERIPLSEEDVGSKEGVLNPEESHPTKWYVDTGPVMEKVWAHRAGLGFIGKITLLIHPRRGSYFFLGVILTVLDLDETPPLSPPTIVRGGIVNTPTTMANGCGTCTACLDACPTGALIEPGVLDSRRCLSYLTIEHRGDIPENLKSHFTEWLFGCDVCQDVCPYNVKFAIPISPPCEVGGELKEGADYNILGKPIHPPAIPLKEILVLEEKEQFLDYIDRRSSLRRTGLERLKRTAELILVNQERP